MCCGGRNHRHEVAKEGAKNREEPKIKLPDLRHAENRP